MSSPPWWLPILGATLAGCIVAPAADDEGADGAAAPPTYGASCELPDTPDVQAACNPEDLTASCVVEGHDGCPTAVCLMWLGGAPYCSERCSAEAACPAGAECRELLGGDRCGPGVAERLLCLCVRR